MTTSTAPSELGTSEIAAPVGHVPPLASGSEISRLIVEAYLEQRCVLNDKLIELMSKSTQWTGYPVAHRDITAELVRIDGILGKLAPSPNSVSGADGK